MMRKHSNLLLVSSAVLVFLCIHANSKPLTDQQDTPHHSFVQTGAEVEYENGLDLLRRITRQADPANGNNSKLLFLWYWYDDRMLFCNLDWKSVQQIGCKGSFVYFFGSKN